MKKLREPFNAYRSGCRSRKVVGVDFCRCLPAGDVTRKHLLRILGCICIVERRNDNLSTGDGAHAFIGRFQHAQQDRSQGIVMPIVRMVDEGFRKLCPQYGLRPVTKLKK
jgi:hypothetical protein